MNRPKAIGTAGETGVARYLAAHGFPKAERRALRGIEDGGDIAGVDGIVWEVKTGDMAKSAGYMLLDTWMQETERERRNVLDAELGVLVVQSRGASPARAGLWSAYVPIDVMAGSYRPVRPRPPIHTGVGDWVCCQLRVMVMYLRSRGYGEPL